MRELWEVIWVLTGGTLLALATSAGAALAFCAVPVGGCLFWRRSRDRKKLRQTTAGKARVDRA